MDIDILQFLQNLQAFELSSITLLMGVLVSAAILRICGINPGGILGSAFFLLAASDSLWWAGTLLLIAVLINWLYDRFFSSIYAGREPVFVMAGMSVILTVAAGLLLHYLQVMSVNAFSFPLGLILPAIIASSVHKQGLLVTARYLLLSIVLTFECIVIIYGIGQWFGYDYLALERLAASRESLELSWSSMYAFASVAIGLLLYRRYRVKAAGFIILPVLATIAVVSPLNFLMLMVTAAAVYVLARFLMRYTLVIGTSRYALVTMLSVALVWTVTYVLLQTTDDFAPYMGTGLFATLAVTVLVNDHIIHGLPKALPVFAIGLAMMACVEVGSAYAMSYLSHDTHSLRYYVIEESTEPYRRR